MYGLKIYIYGLKIFLWTTKYICGLKIYLWTKNISMDLKYICGLNIYKLCKNNNYLLSKKVCVVYKNIYVLKYIFVVSKNICWVK